MDNKDQQYWNKEPDSASNSSAANTSTVDQNAILYDITTTFNNQQADAGQNHVDEDVNSILADIIFEYGIRRDGSKAATTNSADDSAQFEGCAMVNATHLNSLDHHSNLHQYAIKTKVKKASTRTNGTNGKVHKCSHCGKSFPSAYYLKFHENSVHLKVALIYIRTLRK